MNSSSKTLIFFGLVVSTGMLTLSNGDEKSSAYQYPSTPSTSRFEISTNASVDASVVEFREFRAGADAVPAIPKSAIIRENGKTYVFAQPDEKNPTFERWEVTLGYGQNADYVEALTGVFPGDRVATSAFEKLAQQDIQNEPAADENRFVFGDQNGVVVKAPSAYETQAKAPVQERLTAPSYDEAGNRFGYRAEKRSEPRFEVRTYREDPYAYSRGERYIIVPQCEISHQFGYDRTFGEDYGYAPHFAPSCDLSGPGYYYEDNSGYCPNDRYGSWGH